MAKQRKIVKSQQQLHYEARYIAKAKGISFEEAMERLTAARLSNQEKKNIRRLYSAGLKKIKSDRAKKIRETHKISKLQDRKITILQGGSPGLGKKS